ncbi:TniQ family protein [Streptomyces sp. NPDC048200]|uniref:TniQ family protein n=1 Tax=Streptomyces sp. NPDC048200 TaxID=3365512 RepID=UPI00371E7340
MTHTADRSLPRSLAPLPGESLPGFLMRLAYRLNTSPMRIAELTGLRKGNARIPYGYLREIPTETTRKFGLITRLTCREVESLTLSPFASSFPVLKKLRVDSPQIGISARARWAMNASTRFCPDCLHPDSNDVQIAYGGAWQVLWHLPIVFACLRHRRLLETSCPACFNASRGPKQNSSRLFEQPDLAGLHPAQCRNRPYEHHGRRGTVRKESPCGNRLDQIPSSAGADISSEDIDQLLSLQQRLNGRISADPGAITATPSFFDLITAARLIKFSWPLGENLLPSCALTAAIDTHSAPIASLAIRAGDRTGPLLTGAGAAPADALQCGALILAAERLLGDLEIGSLRARVRPLAREAFNRSRSYTGQLLRDSDISTALARATTQRFHGGQTRVILRSTPSAHHYRVEEIPPYLPRIWFDKFFAPLVLKIPSYTKTTERNLRRAVPLRLAELISDSTTWGDCAPKLGITGPIGRRTVQVLGRQLNPMGLWAVFEDIVDALACDLDNTYNRVNYTKRRHLMESWRLPEEDWRNLRADIPRLRALNGVDSKLGTLLIWSEVTQSERSRCPLMRPPNRVAGANELASLAAWYQMPTPSRTTPRSILRRRISLYASRLAAACDSGRSLDVDVIDIRSVEPVDTVKLAGST